MSSINSPQSAPSYPVHIHDRQRDQHYLIQVPADQYILASAEAQGIPLPFACRNGACTTCAVRVRQGSLYQPEAMGISRELKEQGYALLCVGYARSELWVETQDEDEVYELQFGRYFGKGRVRPGIPIEDE
ncbi:MAG: 2Fe-2S iron-sulfur cluster-binding protein [Thermostichus sp. BF3_bins_97]